MSSRSVALALLLVLLGLSPTTGAEDSRSAPLAQQLTSLLDARKLESIATRTADGSDVFVAALYFPGAQLLVISAKYAAPALLNEKILQGNYRDCYIDLNVASDPASKLFVEDLGADGLHASRGEDQPFDTYTKGSAAFPFDGDWKKRKLTETAYMQAFTEADGSYARMLESLIAQLKKEQGS
jgi:hypothetical protein